MFFLKAARQIVLPLARITFPRLGPLLENLLLMNTELRNLKLLIILYSAFATTAVLGQTATNYIWIGAANGTNLATAGNWTTNGVDPAVTLPSGHGLDGISPGDTAIWDGRTTTNLVITYGTVSLPGTGFASLGINLVMTTNQTNSVQVISSVAGSAGVGVNNIEVASGAGAFTWGDTTANNLLTFGRPAGAVHHFVNNSTNPVTINPSVRWQAGGGNGYTYDFIGPGNWIITNDLMPDGGAFSANYVQVDGPGIVYWSAGSTGTYNPNSPLGGITINGGALVLKSAFPPNVPVGNAPITNNANFAFDAASQVQVLAGIISGTGQLIVTNGTLTLAGSNIYTGNTLLNGGELIVAGTENPGTSGPLGVGSLISFSGGTLGFSANNTFDYSPRFSMAAGQAYSFDTAGQNVTFVTDLNSSGATLTKLGPSTLTLAGTSSYSGTTTVSAGKLVFQGTKPGSGDITVADGASLGVVENGSQIAPGTLTLGSSSGCTLEFNNVNSTTTAPLAPSTLSSAGTITINVNSGTLVPGNCYPLLTWTNGPVPTVVLGILNGFIGNLSFTGNTLKLCVTATAARWTGNGNEIWDYVSPSNWVQNGGPVEFTGGGPVLFDDTAPGTTDVFVGAPVMPTSVTANNNILTYNIISAGPNNITGTTSLTKSGTGLLTLSGGANTYTGVTTLNGGTVSVGALANGAAASDIGSSGNGAANLVLNGGTLRYTGGGVSSDRLFTLGTGGGAIDASGTGALNLNNGGAVSYSGTGPRTLALTGTEMDDNTLAAILPDSPSSGPTSLTKSGTGKWVLTGNNTYSGGTTNADGTLQVGSGGASGSLGSGAVVNNGILLFNRSDNVTLTNVIIGTGSLVQYGSGTLKLAAANTYGGTTTVSNGTLIINGSNLAAATIVTSGTLGGTGALSGPVTLATGTTLAPGASIGAVGKLTVNSVLSIGGNLAIEVNKSLAQSNDLVMVSGALTNSESGTLTVANLGPALQMGDKFTLFNKLVQNGAALAVTGVGATWANNLAVDGSISVAAVTRPTLNFTNVGRSVQFSWDTSFGSYKLQSQTNSLSVGLATNWLDYPGGGAGPVTVSIDALNGTIFFRLISTP